MSKGKKQTSGSKRGARKRRGAGEDMTGKKAAQTEVRTASLELPEPVEINADDFTVQLKAATAAFDKFQTAKRIYDNVLKQTKKINADMHAAVKKAMTVNRSDAESIRKELAIFGYVLKHTEHSIQLVIHDTLLGDVTEAAYRRGAKAGEAGDPSDNKYPNGSDLAAEYDRGWQHGQGKKLGLTPEQVDSATSGEGDEEGAGEPHPEGASRPAFLDEQREPELTH